MALFVNVPCWIREIPEHLKTQEVGDEAVNMEPYSLEYVLDRFKTEEMCKEAVCREPYTLRHVPDHFKMQESVTRQYVRTRQYFFFSLIVLKQKKCVKRLLGCRPMATERCP